MKKVLFFLCVLFVITACNRQHEEIYQAILIHGNERYILSGTEEEADLARKIGVVERTVKPHIQPEYNLWSNYLEKGTEVYASKDTETVIYAKDKDGRIQKFQKEKIENLK
jgi:hypothetical protein